MASRLLREAREELARLDAEGLRRRVEPGRGVDFASNDYLGLRWLYPADAPDRPEATLLRATDGAQIGRFVKDVICWLEAVGPDMPIY